MPETKTLSRRDVLKGAGAAAASVGFPTVIPASALGADGAPPPSERVLVAHVGVRNQGMGNLRQHPQNTIAVCDVDRNVLEAARAAAEKASGRPCATYTDYRKLLENKDVDAIVVTTPDHWHALVTRDACAAGKDVYCEKPLSLTVREGQAMVRAARQYGRIVQCGSQQRSDARFRLACELVRSGRLGRIRTVRVGLPGVNFTGPTVPDAPVPPELDYDFWLGPAPARPYNEKRVHYNFRFFWDYSGGQMTNWGAHHLDIAQWGLGRDESGPIHVEGTAEYHPEGWYEVPMTFDLTYRYVDGVTLVCGQKYRQGTTFEGERGWIWVNRGKIEASSPEILQEPLRETDVRLYASESHHGNWLECVKSRKLPICDVEIGHRSATVCHLGNVAIRSGRPVRWDPDRERVVGDAQQAAMLHYGYRAPWSL